MSDATMTCPRCGSTDTIHHGSILSPRGRIQRFECKECGKKFHPSLLSQNITGIEGYLDIESSQAGRGAGNFGIVYSWALKARGGILVSDVIRDSILKEEKRVLDHLSQVLPDFDMVYTWYGTGHDIPVLRSRFLKHGLDFPNYMELLHTDLYYVARGRLKLHSNRLESVAQFFGVPGKTPLNPDVWVQAVYGNTPRERKEALGYIRTHNEGDVRVLEDVHGKLEMYYRGVQRSV